MENPAFSNELIRKRLSEINPGHIFEWAKHKYLFERDNGSEHRRKANVQELARTLNKHLKENFLVPHDIGSHSLDMQFSDVMATTSDAYQASSIQRLGSSWHIVNGETGSVHRLGPLSYLVDIEPMAFGPIEELVGEHTIAGPLVRFHVGEVRDDLRMYIQAGATIGPNGEVMHGGDSFDSMGALIRPVVSIGVATSKIQFAEQTSAERLEDLGLAIKTKLGEMSNDRLNGLFLSFIQKVNEKGVTNLCKLQESAKTIMNIASSTDINGYQHLIDDLCEYLAIKLNFQMPHELESKGHRVVIPRTNPVVKPIQEPYKLIHRYQEFIGIKPQIELVGVTNNQLIALTFQYEDTSIQVPVSHIHRFHRLNL